MLHEKPPASQSNVASGVVAADPRAVDGSNLITAKVASMPTGGIGKPSHETAGGAVVGNVRRLPRFPADSSDCCFCSRAVVGPRKEKEITLCECCVGGEPTGELGSTATEALAAAKLAAAAPPKEDVHEKLPAVQSNVASSVVAADPLAVDDSNPAFAKTLTVRRIATQYSCSSSSFGSDRTKSAGDVPSRTTGRDSSVSDPAGISGSIAAVGLYLTFSVSLPRSVAVGPASSMLSHERGRRPTTSSHAHARRDDRRRRVWTDLLA